MIPILYSQSETDFTTNGIGRLSDAITCEVTEERNGIFELEMQYPVTGLHFSELQDRCIIYAIPSPYRLPQPFRVYRITKPMNGVCTVYAKHITYDLSGVPLEPFKAANAPMAIAGLESNASIESPFSFWTDQNTAGNFEVTEPCSARSVLGGSEGSILDVYGGEYEWDGFTVKLHTNRGHDNGVTIRYGKNLTELEQERDVENVYTGIYPYWKDSDGNMVTCDPKIINAEGDFGFTKIKPVDFSQDIEEKPTPEQLKIAADKYLQRNKISVPTVSIEASFVQLEQTAEYKNLLLFEKCDLCDIVTIKFEQLGVDAKAKIVKIKTDVLLEKYISVEIGDAKTNIADTIVDNENAMEDVPTRSDIEKIADAITNTILGANGGAVRILDTNGDGQLDTLYIADDPDPEKAKKVWRFNYEGWGASANGYNGPFTVAATIDQGMYADFITAGVLNGALLKAGSVNSEALSVEFKNEITEGITTTVDQKFVVAGGELKSEIMEEVETVTGELSSNLSGLQQTDKDFKFYFEMIGVDGETRKGKTEISLDGLTVYDGAIKIMSGGRQVFYAMPDGTLMLDGRVYADAGSHIGGYVINQNIFGANEGTVGINGKTGEHDGIGFYCGGNWTNIANAPVRIYHTGSAYFGKYVTVGTTLDCNNMRVNNIIVEVISGPWFKVHTSFWSTWNGWFDGNVQATAHLTHNRIATAKALSEEPKKDALSIINQINHHAYTKINENPKARGLDTSEVSCGYIGEELSQIDNEMAFEDYTPNGEKIYSIDMSYIQALSTRAIQQLSERIEALEKELSELRGQLNGNN